MTVTDKTMTDKTMTDNGRDDRAAIDKAISLMECFGEEAVSGVGVSELARRSQLSKSTTHRVLAMLEKNGVVERVGTNYRLSTRRFHRLGQRIYAPGHDELQDTLTPFVADLYAATSQTVHLAALHGTDVVYLVKLYGHRQLASPARVGSRLPAHCTAVGKALLAFDRPAARVALSGPLVGFTDRTITDPTALATELDRIRRTGIAVEDGEVRPGMSCVAVAVPGPHGRPVAALSVSGATGELDVRSHGAILRRVAVAAGRAASAAMTNSRVHPPAVDHALAG